MPERDVAVRRAAEDVGLQPLLAELLLVVRAEVLHERVELRVLEPLEVLLAEAGIERAAAAPMPRNVCQWSRWMMPVKVVISLSARPANDAGHRDRAPRRSRRCVIAREPASAIIAAVSAASPSLPAGSWAEPAVNSSFTLSCGSTDFCCDDAELDAGVAPAAGGAADGRRERDAGLTSRGRRRSIPAGSGSCDSVVTIRPASVKYFRAAACRSAGGERVERPVVGVQRVVRAPVATRSAARIAAIALGAVERPREARSGRTTSRPRAASAGTRRRARRGERRQDLDRARRRASAGVLHPREHGEERRDRRWRARRRSSCVHLLLVHDELLVELGRRPEVQRGEDVDGRRVLARSRRTPGRGNATETQGSVSLVHGTCTYTGPFRRAAPAGSRPAPRRPPSIRPSTSRPAAAPAPASRRRRR